MSETCHNCDVSLKGIPKESIPVCNICGRSFCSEACLDIHHDRMSSIVDG